MGLGRPVDQAWRGGTAPPSPSHEAAVTHPGGALGACSFPAGCAGDSPHLRARASAHAGTHAHACTHVHVHARNTRMHTHACSLSPGALRRPRQHPWGPRTPGAACPSAPALSQPHLPWGEGVLFHSGHRLPSPLTALLGSHTQGPPQVLPQPWARVDTGRAAQHFPAGLRLGAGSWLPPSLLLTNRWAMALGPKQSTWGPMRPAPGPEPALPSSTGERLGTLLLRAPSARPHPAQRPSSLPLTTGPVPTALKLRAWSVPGLGRGAAPSRAAFHARPLGLSLLAALS